MTIAEITKKYGIYEMDEEDGWLETLNGEVFIKTGDDCWEED